MKHLAVSTPKQQVAAGFWIACGAIGALLLAYFMFSASKGEANPHRAFYPLASKAPTEEARREFRYWSVSGLLHYHYERRCPELDKLEDKFVGSALLLGYPKRQELGGYEMDPCRLCVKK